MTCKKGGRKAKGGGKKVKKIVKATGATRRKGRK